MKKIIKKKKKKKFQRKWENEIDWKVYVNDNWCREAEQGTYQSEHDAEKLDDVSISDTVETAEQSVRYCHRCADDNGQCIIHAEHHRKNGTCTAWTKCSIVCFHFFLKFFIPILLSSQQQIISFFLNVESRMDRFNCLFFFLIEVL